jgi:hypothetical protein
VTDAPQNAVPTLPPTAIPPGTVDITKLVLGIQKAWVTYGTKIAVEAAKNIPYLGPFLRAPVISHFLEYIIGYVMKALAETGEQQAFFLNTAIRKAGQADEFIEATSILDRLPKTASKEEYKNAETKRLVAFRNFVLLSN